MASSLATSGIENRDLLSFLISLTGHIVLIGFLFFLPTPRKKVFVESIPRSVRLVATLDEPPSPAPPAAVKRKRTKVPVSKPRPKVIKPVPKPVAKPAPKPAPSRVLVPAKKAPPIVKPREASPPPISLKEKLAERLSSLEKPPAETPVRRPPDLPVPEVAPLPVPTVSPIAAPADSDRQIVPLSNFPYAWYIALVKEKIFAGWTPPSTFALGGRRITAVVSFRISRGGEIGRVDLKESSGHRLFDKSALSVLSGMASLPPLPKDYKEEFLDVVIRFQNQN